MNGASNGNGKQIKVPLSMVITIVIFMATTASGWIAYAKVLPEHNMMAVAARTAVEAKELAQKAVNTSELNKQRVEDIKEAIDKLDGKMERLVQGVNNLASKIP